MRTLVLQRVASFLVSMLAASLVIFALTDLLPGDATAALLGTGARADTVATLRHQLGLDQPAVWRYLHWIAGAVTGNLGRSAAYGVPVRDLLADRLPVTVPLAALALAVALATGIPLGVAAAGRPGGPADRMAALVSQVGIAVPDFWLGLLLILLFSTLLPWFPAGGFPGWDHPLAALQALVLPAVALALPQAAVLCRVTRAAVLETMADDFIRTARAKGLRRRRILWRHAARNALVPVVTIVGLQSSFLIAGAVLVETVFNLPGLGRLAYQALAQRDLVVMRSVAMLFAALVILVNFAVDLSYAWLDPRLRAR